MDYKHSLVQLVSLLENKNHLIDRLDLSDEQKAQLKAFFQKYPNYESKIDWNRKDLKWEDFQGLLDSEGKSKSQAKKKGLEGLIEGKDYVIIDQGYGFIAYQPLTYLGSVTLASNKIPPAHEAGAKWCISYQKTTSYWDNYTSQGIKFIFVCTSRTKYALVKYPKEHAKHDCFSFDDKRIPCPKQFRYLFDKTLQDYPAFDLDFYLDKKLLVKEEDGSFSCLNSDNIQKINLKHFVKDGKFTVKFNKWIGDFNCVGLDLTSLEGSPRRVHGGFYCNSNLLTSLKGAPDHISGSFNCSFNHLTSLEGGPSYVGITYYCSLNNLISLKGAPKEIEGTFECFSNQLTSLEGAPKKVGQYFICSQNKLTSLKDGPEWVKGPYSCTDNQLTSLEGAPKFCGASFNCGDNKLTSFKGLSGTIVGDLSCRNNPLESLKLPDNLKLGGKIFYSARV